MNMMKTKKIIVLPLILVLLLVSVPVKAASSLDDCRLYSCLRNDHMYLAVSLLALRTQQNSDDFKKKYDDTYVVISQDITVESIKSNNKGITIVNSSGGTCTIDTSAKEVKDVVATLSVGDSLIVYGKMSVSGINSYSFKIEAEHILPGTPFSFERGSYVFYSSAEYYGTLFDTLTSRGNVSYMIPSSWDDQYVGDLYINENNNGVTVYQYYLNALPIQNTDSPEIFYIFYFDNETHLDNSKYDIKKVEKAIIENILPDHEEKNLKIKIETIETSNGIEFNYFSTMYKTRDGKDYRLEFLFKPDQNGIVCMMYLYFPREGYVRHTRDVAYLIETMKVE